MKGGTVCRMHGGSAPQVRAAAQRRLLALVDPAMGKLAQGVASRKGIPKPTEIEAAKQILAGGRGQKPMPQNGERGLTWEEFVVMYRRGKATEGAEEPSQNAKHFPLRVL